MIEILDVKDAEPNKLDITPELALAAYNTLIQFCRQQEKTEDDPCTHCNFSGGCTRIPEEWEKVHYPALVDNSMCYHKAIEFVKLHTLVDQIQKVLAQVIKIVLD